MSETTGSTISVLLADMNEQVRHFVESHFEGMHVSEIRADLRSQYRPTLIDAAAYTPFQATISFNVKAEDHPTPPCHRFECRIDYFHGEFRIAKVMHEEVYPS